MGNVDGRCLIWAARGEPRGSISCIKAALRWLELSPLPRPWSSLTECSPACIPLSLPPCRNKDTAWHLATLVGLISPAPPLQVPPRKTSKHPPATFRLPSTAVRLSFTRDWPTTLPHTPLAKLPLAEPPPAPHYRTLWTRRISLNTTVIAVLRLTLLSYARTLSISSAHF